MISSVQRREKEASRIAACSQPAERASEEDEDEDEEEEEGLPTSLGSGLLLLLQKSTQDATARERQVG